MSAITPGTASQTSASTSLVRAKHLSGERGFILILVLVLVALVTILMVVISIMARIERHASYNAARIEQARENALFALNVAVGQLQREAGPDQRVTARADILSGTTGAAFNQPYWSGIWKTYNPAAPTAPLDSGSTTASFDQQVGGAIRPWSTNPNLLGGSNSPYTVDPANPNMAWLVASGTTQLNPLTWIPTLGLSGTFAQNLGSSGTGVAVAPLLPITSGSSTTSGTIGKYGYWVSDEGIKARVNIPDPTMVPGSTATNFAQQQMHFMAPLSMPVSSTNAVPGVLALLGTSNQTDLRSVSNLNATTTLQSLGLISGISGLSGTDAEPFSADVTTYSDGVLSDAAHGGLKIDLSALFEDNGRASPQQFAPFVSAAANPAMDASGDAKVWELSQTAFNFGNNSPPVYFGTRWQSLYNYYNLYKTLIPSSAYSSGAASSFAGIAGLSANAPGSVAPEINMSLFNYDSIYAPAQASPTATMGEYYMPRIAALSYNFWMSTVVQSGSTQMRIYLQPQYALYNPYNVTLVPPSGSNYSFSISSNMLSVKVSVQVGNQTPFNNSRLEFMCGSLLFKTGSGANLTFRPGEIKVFGVGTPGSEVKSGTIGNLTGYPLMNDPAGFVSGLLPVCNGTASTVAWSSTTTLLTDPVSVTLSKTNFTSNNGFQTISGEPAWPYSPLGTSQASFGRVFVENPNESGTMIPMGTVGSLQSTGNLPVAQFAQFALRIKGIDQSQTATGALSQIPIFSNVDGLFGPLPHVLDNGSFDIDFALTQNPNSAADVSLIGTAPDIYTTWGKMDVGISASDPAGIILHDIPRQPMVSIGQFMHMAMRNSMATSDAGSDVDECNCLYPVGGSLCDPWIPLSGTSWQTGAPAYTGPAAIDDNFAMNQGLFDAYFFSTVPPLSQDASYKNCFPAYSSGTTQFTAANVATRSVTLPNSRMHFYFKNGVPPASTAPLQQYTTAAANLLLSGAFNVNSTSVPAWEALLSSLSGNAAKYLTAGGFLSIAPAQLENPIFRILNPFSIDGSSTVNTAWGGTHSLSNTQVQNLAKAIVNQVKARGPFLSMADFLNRRLDPNTDPAIGLGYKGALQAAIDSTSINSTNLASSSLPVITSSNTVTVNRVNPYGTVTLPANTFPSNTSFGVPGWLIQNDLVQSFAPVMTVRSDTFVVRCYGEADNKATGAREGSAWCEAVVQRLPDFVDQTDTGLAGTPALGDATPLKHVNSVNVNFGRRFKVVSFRWLNATDL